MMCIKIIKLIINTVYYQNPPTFKIHPIKIHPIKFYYLFYKFFYFFFVKFLFDGITVLKFEWVNLERVDFDARGF